MDNSNNLKWKWDKITAFATIVIALIALGVSIWQGAVTRTHNRLTVRPVLQIEGRCIIKENPGVYVKNVGIGPAVFKGIAVKFNNEYLKPPKGDTGLAESITQQLTQVTSITKWERQPFYKDRVLQPGEELIYFAADKPCGSYQQLKQVSDAMSKYSYIVKYASMYGEEFQSAP